MQASKIVIGKTYAVKIGDDLHRLRVTEVVTARKGQHASDFKHRIFGVVEGLPKGERVDPDQEWRPDQVLGPFEDYAALVRQKQEEEAKREAEKKADQDAAEHLISLLYRISGLEKPQGKERWHHPICEEYTGCSIRKAAVQPLITALERLMDYDHAHHSKRA